MILFTFEKFFKGYFLITFESLFVCKVYGYACSLFYYKTVQFDLWFVLFSSKNLKLKVWSERSMEKLLV